MSEVWDVVRDEDASFDLAVVRIALAILLYGVACVIIDWATGPLSPSVHVKGLIPDHVRPLRLRLRFLALTLVASFVVLGTRWLTIRIVDPDVTGRVLMIFLVAVSLFYMLSYLGRIPGMVGRFRLIRYLATFALIAGIGALFLGFQNLAGYLIHGVTRTALALFILWIILWLILMASVACVRKGTHLAVDYATHGRSFRIQRFLRLLTAAVAMFFFGVVIVSGYLLIAATLNQTTPALRIPIGLVYLAFPITGLLMLLETSIVFARTWSAVEMSQFGPPSAAQSG